MTNPRIPSDKPSRLAAALRENLRRRKEQSRARQASATLPLPQDGAGRLGGGEGKGLPDANTNGTTG